MTQATELKSRLICLYLSFVRTNTKFSIKIFEIDFVIEINWYLTFWPLPRATGGGAKKWIAVARPIYVSNLHTKFGWISSNGFGGDSITDRRTDRQTGGGNYNIPFAFLKKRGDKKDKYDTVKTLYNVTRYNRIFNIRHKIAGNRSVSVKMPSL